MKIIEPVKEREAFFNGWETDNANYLFECSACKQNIEITFKEMLDGAWGWDERTEPNEKAMVADIFGIDLNNRSIGNGMKSIVTRTCPSCNSVHDLFFWFHEYRHSCYDISLRGVSKR